ncbi:MAG: zinc-ribbon domain-containing protein, partial [Desulfobaccales bacterium]
MPARVTGRRCKECGAELSPEALVCPQCGAPRPEEPEPKGRGFEWRSAQTFLGYPLIHIAVGKDARGKWRVAKGVIAIGQFAVGLITVAQFGVGLLFGFGQFILGYTAVAQVAVALYFGLGQVATGYVAVGQVVCAHFGLGQLGWATHLWTPYHRDPQAVAYFTELLEFLSSWFPVRKSFFVGEGVRGQ